MKPPVCRAKSLVTIAHRTVLGAEQESAAKAVVDDTESTIMPASGKSGGLASTVPSAPSVASGAPDVPAEEKRAASKWTRQSTQGRRQSLTGAPSSDESAGDGGWWPFRRKKKK